MQQCGGWPGPQRRQLQAPRARAHAPASMVTSTSMLDLNAWVTNARRLTMSPTRVGLDRILRNCLRGAPKARRIPVANAPIANRVTRFEFSLETPNTAAMMWCRRSFRSRRTTIVSPANSLTLPTGDADCVGESVPVTARCARCDARVFLSLVDPSARARRLAAVRPDPSALRAPAPGAGVILTDVVSGGAR